ncbi:MAG: HD domain-containing protein [Denitratisoma sp.]|nr:HD domain-containing protein [Denitratisoma sp.]
MTTAAEACAELPASRKAPARGGGRRFFRGIHRVVAKRLAIAWILLSLAVGGAATYLELRRIDDLATGLAIAASDAFRNHVNSVGIEHAESLNGAMQPLLKQNFAHVQVTDAAARVVAEAAAPDGAGLMDGLAGAGSHRTAWRAGELLVWVSVPLQYRDGTAIGGFRGVYRVDAATRRHARADLVRNVSVLLLAILATAIVLYPVIIGLNRGVLQLSAGLMRSNIELMEVLGSAIAKRDSDTDLHNYRVCLYSIRFAEALGLAEDDIRAIVAGAFLHDVGKIGISDTILLKPGKLTEAEFAVMKTHVQLGMDIVARSGWLRGAREVIEFHHERFDGSGYQKGLKGEAIPLAARIFAIVDVFDALTSRRPYKEPLPFDKAMDILAEGRGSHFDPRLFDVFADLAVGLHAELDGLAEQALRDRLHGLVTKYFFEGRDFWQQSGCPAWLAEQCAKRDA